MSIVNVRALYWVLPDWKVNLKFLMNSPDFNATDQTNKKIFEKVRRVTFWWLHSSQKSAFFRFCDLY